MRRIVPFLCIAAALTACDPTGNGLPVVASTHFRIADFVLDGTGMTVANDAGAFISGTPFGSASLYSVLPADTTIFTYTSDTFALGTDTVALLQNREYTVYGLGTITDFKALVTKNDTVVATPGQFKVRFIHSVGTFKFFSLDFYVDTATSISGLTPSYPGLGYGSASLYVPIDTALHRLRITRNGLTTILLDTTFATPPTSGSVVTIVATNVQGGGTALLATIVPDTIP